MGLQAFGLLFPEPSFCPPLKSCLGAGVFIDMPIPILWTLAGHPYGGGPALIVNVVGVPLRMLVHVCVASCVVNISAGVGAARQKGGFP